MRTVEASPKINTIVKDPNAVMNDYTKNISQSIFTPGVYQNQNRLKTVKLSKNFKKTDQRKSAFENQKYLLEDVKGMRATVQGRIGEKHMQIIS